MVASAAVVAVLLVFVFPTRTYLDQRHQLAVATRRLQALDAANAQLAAKVDKLHSDSEIERLARERYHLVRPGEQAFAILPAPATPAPPRPGPPARSPGSSRPPSGIWEKLVGWL